LKDKDDTSRESTNTLGAHDFINTVLVTHVVGVLNATLFSRFTYVQPAAMSS